MQIPKCPQHGTDAAGHSTFQDLPTCFSAKARIKLPVSRRLRSYIMPLAIHHEFKHRMQHSIVAPHSNSRKNGRWSRV